MFGRTLTATTRSRRVARVIVIALLAVTTLLVRQAPTNAAAAAARLLNRTVATATTYTRPVLSAVRRIKTIELSAMSGAAGIGEAAAASGDISTAPLVEPTTLVWEGSFRVPEGPFGTSEFETFAYGGAALAFNPAHNSLFMAGHENGQLATEITIPNITKGPALGDLHIAGLLQRFSDPTAGFINSINPDSPNQKKIGGIFPYQGKLHVSAYDYYDGGGTQLLSHFIADMDLRYQSGPQRVKFCTPGDDNDCLGAGYFDGYFGRVPQQWQQAFGGTSTNPVILNGNCCLNVINRTSWGPALFAIDPTQLGATDPDTGALIDVAAKPLVYYWSDGADAADPSGNFHALAEPELRPGDPVYVSSDGLALNDGCHNTSTLFNCTSEVKGVVFPEGTRSVLFFGRQGLGNFCYGAGTSDKALHGTPVDGEPDVVYCYDPADHNKGTHAWPYAHYVWAYDANDLKAVADLTTLPWEVKPYAVWQLDLPFDAPYGVTSGADLDVQNRRLGGAAYDPASGRVFVSQTFDDGRTPLIHVFKLAVAAPAPNSAPLATGGSNTTAEDTQVSGTLSATDADADGLTFSLSAAASHGSAVVAPNGSYTYAPALDFSGPDSFSFSVSDGRGGSATATVDLTVTPVNDAPVADAVTGTTPEDTPLTATLHATDVDDVSLKFALAAPAAHGAAVVRPDGSYTYTSDLNFNGTDTFTYSVMDEDSASSTATVTVTVTAVNDAPTATAASVAATEDTPLTIVLAGSDVDNDALSFAVAGAGPSHGTLTGDGASRIYTPAPDFNGTDSFAFTATDSHDVSSSAVVTIAVTAVNDAPTAAAGSNTTPEDTALTATVTANDIDGDTLAFSLASQASHGTAAVTPDGHYTYTPALNYNGADSFSYSASDGNGGSATAVVNVAVTPVNDAPTASAQSATTAEDTQAAITLSGSDVDDDALTYDIVVAPANGTITGTGASRIYVPAANYNGPDTLTYTVSDGHGGSATGVVSITITAVNDGPVAVPQVRETAEDTPVSLTLTGADVEGDGLTFAVLGSGPGHGRLVGAGMNPVYMPAPNFYGSDSFTFTVSDGLLTSPPATVTITVLPVNDAPVAGALTLTTTEETPLAIALAGSDGDADIVAFAIVSEPGHGTLSGTDANRTYTPDTDFNGVDSFTYAVSDPYGGSSSATVSITVTPANDAPVTDAGSVTTLEDTPANGTLVARDSDSDSLTFALGAGATHGTVTVAADGSYVYTPASNYNGPDSFTFTASDGGATSAAATVTITVEAVNDAPVANAQSVTTPEDAAASIALTGSDVDEDALAFDIASAPAHGTLTGTGSTRSYTPDPNYSGTDTFTFTVGDGVATSAAATVTITVTSVDDAPVAESGTNTTVEDTAVSGTLHAADIDGNNLQYALGNSASHGVAVVSANGSYTYTPAANYNGSDQFTFTATDGTFPSPAATVTITIAPANDSPIADSSSTTAQQGVAVTGSLHAADVDGDSLQFMLAAPASHGTAVVAADGSYSYTAAATYNGADSFSYTVSDGHGASATGVVSIVVTTAGATPLGKFVVFSNDMTWVQANTTIFSGDVGANARHRSEHPHEGDYKNGGADDVTVRIGQRVTMQQPGSRVVGDTVRLDDKASIYDVLFNVLVPNSRRATILGTPTTPMTVPFLSMPEFPNVVPGTAAIEVAKGATRTLAAGAYGRIHVNSKATLVLSGGLYEMVSLDLDASATVIFRGPAEVRISTELDTANRARMILDPASAALKASDVVFYVAGSDGYCRHDGRDEESGEGGGGAVVHIGENNVVQANIYAPRGTLRIKSKTQATGAFLGDDVRIGQNVTLRLDSSFR